MSLKIENNRSVTAYHVIEGATVFPYAVDAYSAIGRFPSEWSAEPWSAAETAAARKERGEADIELSPEDQATLAAHQTAVEEAAARLAKFHADQEEKRKLVAQVAADEAIVNSAPPTPTFKRPFGRTGEPTPAELEQIKKREAKKADDERIAGEKAEADKLAGASAK